MATTSPDLIPNYDAYNKFASICEPVIEALGGYTAHNLENLADVRDRPVIFAPNHRANIDSFVLGLTLHTLPSLTRDMDEQLESRPLHFMAKDTLWRYPGIRQLVESCHAFPVARNKGTGLRKDQVEHIERLADINAALAIYPEGTRRSKERDGVHRDKLKTTVGFLALRYGFAVVPVGIAGPNGLTKLPMDIVFEEPIRVAQRSDVNTDPFNSAKYGFMDELHASMDKAYQEAKSYQTLR